MKPSGFQIEQLIEAVDQCLDDMGAEGKCVCGHTKAALRLAIEPFLSHYTDRASEPLTYTFKAALQTVVEIDESHGKPSPLRPLLAIAERERKP